ncbi:hypothetical protein BRDID11004_20820 [Bradyrhizobium diazoefficiens]|uniref:Uncharacterized protein n=1 Tax=Bradyrhizobium diazoefficiens TaxID=1355477 RepID=A0A810A3K9_9BRAD|nr:hypothetical protein BDHF08_65410 [Bradyrhizobium diazoefficiens]BCE59104.1 hypothetical protein XF5B_66160 [Bradyrhizobium diazoefficiens]BCE67784.1 hypothetical protein XF6B_65830 [Bradyrhizobium diazoefficiens]
MILFVIPGRPQGEPGIHFSAEHAAQSIPGLRATHASRNDGGCGWQRLTSYNAAVHSAIW